MQKTTVATSCTREFRDEGVAQALELAAAFERDWQAASREHYAHILEQVATPKAVTELESAFAVEFSMKVTFRDEAQGTWKEARPVFRGRTDFIDLHEARP
jgi:delta 1-pyrroline-5-carboxylate dehydrogenase